MPLGSASGGGPWSGGGGDATKNIGRPYMPGGMNSQQQAALNWLQGASGMNLSNYNNTIGALNAQRNAINGAAGAANAAAGRDYSLTMRGIDQDLMYGNQLRDQERYRNVDLGRARSASDWQYAGNIWNILRGDIGARQGFARREFGLANQGTQLQYGTGMRQTESDAIARGARTAQGTIDRFGDVRANRDIGLGQNKLGLDSALNSLKTEYRQGAERYNQSARNYGLDQKTFDSIAKTYGIQAAQAAAQAALARDRAAANRASAGSNAGAGRASALANLQGGQSTAYNNYMQTQMGLMQQLYGMGG